jgi:thiol-disulfide isomerase/thioredoxin
MKNFITLLGICTILLFTACSSEPKQEAKKEVKSAPESFLLKDINSGAEYTLVRQKDGFVVKGHEHKVIMFDMYATYCGPCQKEAQHLTSLQVKHADKFLIIALNTFEEVTNQYINDEFRFKYGGYYFITNSKDNEEIIALILKDIGYKRTIQIPFKVVLKDGKYQTLTDIYKADPDNKYYIGEIETKTIEKDLDGIFKK